MSQHYINNPTHQEFQWKIICMECDEHEHGTANTKEAALKTAWQYVADKELYYYESGASYEPDSCGHSFHVQITTTETYV